MSADPAQFKNRVRAILTQHHRHVVRDEALICAAVLVPLLFKEGEWHVLVTQRSQSVGHHKGQVSFPGGACEAGDDGLLDTALREAHEEIGVPPQLVDVLGALDDFPTISRFVVTPYVGVIPHPFDYRLNRDEVEAIIEVPLAFLRSPTHLREEQLEHDGQIHDVLFWDYDDCTIWGATARTLKGFLDLVF
jgi:8-oxo-dGTP pyrophosphatase MutT (NUDIX family)